MNEQEFKNFMMNEISIFRKRFGMNQKKLAELLEIPQGHLSKIARGKIMPSAWLWFEIEKKMARYEMLNFRLKIVA